MLNSSQCMLRGVELVSYEQRHNTACFCSFPSPNAVFCSCLIFTIKGEWVPATQLPYPCCTWPPTWQHRMWLPCHRAHHIVSQYPVIGLSGDYRRFRRLPEQVKRSGKRDPELWLWQASCCCSLHALETESCHLRRCEGRRTAKQHTETPESYRRGPSMHLYCVCTKIGQSPELILTRSWEPFSYSRGFISVQTGRYFVLCMVEWELRDWLFCWFVCLGPENRLLKSENVGNVKPPFVSKTFSSTSSTSNKMHNNLNTT
jgi:hypothetical protein